jgi:hypothetical protein
MAREFSAVRQACVLSVAVALLAPGAQAQPSNDRCSDAILLAPNVLISGTTLNANSDLQGTACAGFLDPLDVWYRFVAASAGLVTFHTGGSSSLTTLAVYRQCSGNGASGLLGCGVDDFGAGAVVALELLAGEQVVIRVAGDLGTDGPFLLTTLVATSQTGVCCRGATCAAAATSAQCTGVNTLFVNVAACNVAGNVTSPCCRADFNKVGGVNTQDIFDFLAMWFASDVSADFTGNGTSTPAVLSIFEYLNAWFAGGC